MTDFEKARDEALKVIQDYEDVTILGNDSWDITTEILRKEGCGQEITLRILLSDDFPLSIPIIQIAPKDLGQLKYLPHIFGDSGAICLYDSDSIRTDPANPAGVILECLKKAKRIISQGILEENFSEYDEEFISYWECRYGEKDGIYTNVLSLVNGEPLYPEDLKLILLEKALSSYKYIIHQGDEIAKRFIQFLESNNLKHDITEVFYCGNLSFTKPPYVLKNKDADKLVSDDYKKRYEKFINKGTSEKVIVGTVNADGRKHLVGWVHKKLVTERNGYRPGALKQYYVLRTMQGNDYVNRISPQIYTPSRLSIRTSGNYDNTTEKKFLIAGLGSIGSNLCYYLNSLGSPQFRLVDMDTLKIENTPRHFLGFEHVGMYKVEGMKAFLTKKNPAQAVDIFSKSILEVFKNDIDFINNVDFVFMVTGKDNVDRFMADKVSAGIITKPMFVIWVEPYIAGGHCVYIHPNSDPYSKYFDTEGYFNFNIIDKQEYIDNNASLSLKEAGCNTTYTPYSGSNVVAFLSALYPVILKIIVGNVNVTTAFTYIGDKSEIQRKGIRVSSFGQKHSDGSIVEHKL